MFDPESEPTPARIVPPKPGQQSAWDFPARPRVEPCRARVEARFAHRTIADTTRALRVVARGHAPVYYIPRDDVDTGALEVTTATSWCEFKGMATYYDLRVKSERAPLAAWSYHDPRSGYGELRGHVAFYARPLSHALVDGERALPQPGVYYGGWVTEDVVGPFRTDPR